MRSLPFLYPFLFSLCAAVFTAAAPALYAQEIDATGKAPLPTSEVIVEVPVAEGKPHLVIDRSVAVEFAPREAYFIVTFDQERFYRVPAFFLSPQDLSEEENLTDWHFAASLPRPEGEHEVHFGLLLLGDGSRTSFYPPITWDLDTTEIYAGQVEKLREHVGREKKVYASWNMQLSVQQSSLDRLRADAEVIGNLKRISDITDEIEQSERALVDVEKDIKNLKDFLRLASASPNPRNFARREHELNKQLTELARAATLVERGEKQRKSRSQTQLSKQLRLVEETRAEDFDNLRAELERVRKRREKLEREYGAGGGPVRENDEYELPQG